MESNMEARNMPNTKTDPNYYHGSSNRYSTYSNSGNFAMRPNASLPRKFNTNTSIPIRNDYFNYSHGKFNFSKVEKLSKVLLMKYSFVQSEKIAVICFSLPY